ncbi:MAG: hypothetical protein JXR63_05735 [Spirochaetales bacterium]|nr:hypothetical protein [Spirochaetales bacterium]
MKSRKNYFLLSLSLLTATLVIFNILAFFISSSVFLSLSMTSISFILVNIIFLYRQDFRYRIEALEKVKLEESMRQLEDELKILSIKNSEMDDALQIDLDEKQDFNRIFNHAIYAYELFEKGKIVFDKLIKVIAQKTEEVMFDISDEIDQLSSNGEKLEDNIERFLKKVSKGDDSLEDAIKSLKSEVREVMSIDDIFKDLETHYNKDMNKISKSIHDIKDYSENISDIADKSGLLAINASIEATRAGAAGKGFFVIANEMQELSKISKSTSEKIYEMMEEIAKMIDFSYENQRASISNVVNHLDNSKAVLERVSDSLTVKIEGMDHEIDDARDISREMKEILDLALMKMQMQDPITQMMAHSQLLIDEINKKITDRISNIKDYSLPEDEIFSDIKNIISNLFTIQDEWDAIKTLDIPQLHSDDDVIEGGIELF